MAQLFFPSKEIRDRANKKVPADSRLTELDVPLTEPKRIIFNAERMVYGGFQPIVESNPNEAEQEKII